MFYLTKGFRNSGMRAGILRVAFTLVVCASLLSVCFAVTYTTESKSIDCCDRTVSLLKLTSADCDQGVAAQNAAWATFKSAHPGLVDTDRTGNQTYTYNCHSFCYNNSDRWLNVGPSGLDKFYNSTGSDCWKEDSSGTVKTKKTGSDHSCKVTNNEGKCGPNFRCKNNQHVYAVMPTTKYKKNP
jgi:hypothetical protein